MLQGATALEILTLQMAYIQGAIDRAKRTLPDPSTFEDPESYDFYVTIHASDETSITSSYTMFFGAKPVRVTGWADRC